MNVVYAPILREQFNQLYRFGYTTVATAILVEADTEGQPTQGDTRRVIEKFTQISPFEYEEEYVVLQIRLSGVEKTGLQSISIRDVQRIFPLNKRAKGFMEDRLDSRIKFQLPVFEAELGRQLRERTWRDAEQAVYSLWEYFGLPNAEQQAWTFIDKFKEDIQQGLDARLNGIKVYNLKEAEYWAYVIAYDRYESYPARTLGYFYDSGQLYAYKRGVDFEKTKLYGLFEQCRLSNPNGMSFNEIEKFFHDSATEKYRDDTTFRDELETPIRGYLITPIFLLLKEEIRNSKAVDQTPLFAEAKYIQKWFSESEFKVLITLLGCFFGYRKFYDVFYEYPPLPIFSENPQGAENIKKANKLEVSTGAKTAALPKSTVIEIATIASNEKLEQKPEITNTNRQEQLGLFDEHTQKLKKSTSKPPSLTKTDEEILNDLAHQLRQPGNEEGIALTDIAKGIKGKTTKQMTELLTTDNRFKITYGKPKRVTLTNNE